MGDMDRKHLLDALDLGNIADAVKVNLEEEGRDMLIQMLRQKMGAMGGGGGVAPAALSGGQGNAQPEGMQPAGA